MSVCLRSLLCMRESRMMQTHSLIHRDFFLIFCDSLYNEKIKLKIFVRSSRWTLSVNQTHRTRRLWLEFRSWTEGCPSPFLVIWACWIRLDYKLKLDKIEKTLRHKTILEARLSGTSHEFLSQMFISFILKIHHLHYLIFI